MATAYTSLLGLALPVTGELSGSWGDVVNTSITSLLDSAISGTTSITTDADTTLTTTTGAANQARQAIILWNPASGTVTRNITAPAQSKIYTVINASGGTQSIVFRGAGPTTGVTIVKGESAVVAWNGTDFIKISNAGGAASFTNVTVSGTTTLSGLTASTALALDASKNVVSVTNTGTGNNVLSVSPTLTGTISGANASLSGTLGVTGVATFTAQPILSSLTASQAVFTDGSKGLVSNAVTGTGNVVMSASPTLTGTITAAAANFSGAVALGDAAADNITVNGTVTSNLIFTDNTYDIGASGATRPRNLFLAGNATVGGNIVLTGSLDLTNLEVTNIKAKDGTAGMQIADSTGVVSFTANPVMSGGTANGVPYLNGSKVLTTGSALTFDGASFTNTAGTINAAGFASRATGGEGGQLSLNNPTDTGSVATFDVSNATTARLFTTVNDALLQIGQLTGTGGNVAFFTATTERMRITAAGNVGIGTSSPGALLHIQGANVEARLVETSSSYAFGPRGFSAANAIYSIRELGANRAGIVFDCANQFVTIDTAATERMRIDSAGRVGIGGSPGAGQTLTLLKPVTGATTAYGTLLAGVVQSDVTIQALYNSTFVGTQATAFTLPTLTHYFANQGTFGAGSTVSNQYGFFANGSLTGATNNFGFYSNIPAGAGRWNFYANSTASNFFGGNVGIGASPTYQLQVFGTGQDTAALTDAGNKGGSLYLQASGVGSGSGGAVLFGTTFGNQTPFAAIKGLVSDGGTNTVGDLAFSTRAAVADTALTERMRITPAGNVGIGGSSGPGRTLTISKGITGATTGIGVLNNGTVQSDVTSTVQYHRTTISTAASNFSIGLIYGYTTGQGALGNVSSGGSITSQAGFVAESTIIGATTNFGFLSDIPAGTGRWNFYSNGTASNFFGGNTIISVTDNTNAALRITQLGTGNALLVEDSANPDATPTVIDTNGRLVVGNTASVPVLGVDSGVQTWASFGYTSQGRFTNDAFGSFLSFVKSRNTTVGGQTVVQSGDVLGAVAFTGSDGTAFIQAARIEATVDGTPGTNDMPGRLVFSTTADGSANPTERMRITSAGDVGIGTTSPAAKLSVTQGSSSLAMEIFGNSSETTLRLINELNTVERAKISATSANALAFSTFGSERMRIDSSGNVLIGSTAAQLLLNPVNNTQSANALQVNGANYPTASASVLRSSDTAIGPYLVLASSRGSLAAKTASTNNDAAGTISFQGYDGTNFLQPASIAAFVDAAPGTNDMPGRLVFSTTADGASAPTERARIDSSGNLIQSAPTTPPTLATNGQMVFNLTSNTNLRVSVRGSDGVTRTANITLA
jgi:hypothetical protein